MAKFFVALTALLMIAGCSCNKDAATTETPATTEAPAMGDAAATPMDAATAPSEHPPETMGTDPAATATPAAH